MRLRALFAFPFAIALGSSTAFAQDRPSLDLRGWASPLDPDGGVTLEPASAPATGDLNLGLRLHYSAEPLVASQRGSTVSIIDHQVTGEVLANVGIAERIALGFDLPYLVLQSGDDFAADRSLTSAFGASSVPRVGIGDLALRAKVVLIPPTDPEFNGFGLAILQRTSLPTGDERSFLGEGHLTSDTRLSAEWRRPAYSVLGMAGVKFRGEKEEVLCADVEPPLTVAACPSQFGHEIPLGLGLAVRPKHLGLDDAGRWTWFVETRAIVPLAPVAPFEAAAPASAFVAAAARYRVRDVGLFGGVEVGLTDGVGSAPVRITLGVELVPRERDRDGDGIEDDVDLCPDLPEDRDGFEDADGCPDPDDDGDGIPDALDACPRAAEDFDGFEDADGCPDTDNDGDGILDDVDACPDEPGVPSRDPSMHGCPVRDRDGDGILDDVDACPDEPGVASEDSKRHGCPGADRDGDGILDDVDACPDEPGVASEDPARHGCPIDPDPDRDGILGADDRCPNDPEDYDGFEDENGCPDAGRGPRREPLVTVREGGGREQLVIRSELRFEPDGTVAAESVPLLRAVAATAKTRGRGLRFGVRPVPGNPDLPVRRALAIAEILRRALGREGSVEIVPFDEVRGEPHANVLGVGFALGGSAADR